MMMNGLYKENTTKKLLYLGIIKRFKIMMLFKKLSITTALLGLVITIGAQCESWIGSPNETEASDAHSVYRQSMKTKDYDIAFENWQIAYKLAPAADGKRDYHFVDGAALYLEKFKAETDKAKKDEYRDLALGLIDAAIECYDAGTIKLKSCGDNAECYEQKKGYLAGRKAFDMYYTYNTPYSQTQSALEMAVAKGGNNTEYIVFDPYAAIVVYQFGKGKMDKSQARGVYEQLNAIADHNIENNSQYGAYYKQAKDAMNAKFAEIESDIFDCDYFINKMKPQYDANPDDIETIKLVYATLKKQDCDPNKPFVKELDSKWQKYVSVENAKIQAQFEANNPAVAAKKAYDAGDFNTAIAKYDEAIAQEGDPSKKATYQFSKASIQYRKLKQYSAARKTALEAAKNKPGYGRPYMLIGDMYGSGARNCGDAWNQRLAILAAIDKYRYAKSVDPSVADDANARISKYNASKPSLEEGFQRGIKAGTTVTVGCWIGEKVKVSYAK